MTIINKPTLVSLLWISIGFTFCNGQVKTYLPKENAIISTDQLKLIKAGDGNVHCSLQDKNGNLWFGTTDEGVYRYDARLNDEVGQGKSLTNFTTRNGLHTNSIFSILEDKKGNIWFGTNSGLSHYNGKTFTYIPISLSKGDPSALLINELSSENFVTSILEDKTGKLWFGTNNGVYCYDGKVFTWFLNNQNLINSNGLKLQLVQCMLQDKHGSIWFTTKMEGVCRYDGKSVINYKPDNQEWFRGLLEDKNGNIWVGTRYKGVYRYDGKTFTKILQNGSFDSYTVLSIIQDKSGDIWFGTEAGDPSKRETEGGVWVYNGVSFKNFSKKDGLNNNAVWCALEDRSGNLWFGTRNTGLSRYDGKTFTSFSE